MLRVGEQHADKHDVDDDQECMESITPVAKSMSGSVQRPNLTVVTNENCGRSLWLWCRRCKHGYLLSAEGSLFGIVIDVNSSSEDVDERLLIR